MVTGSSCFENNLKTTTNWPLSNITTHQQHQSSPSNMTGITITATADDDTSSTVRKCLLMAKDENRVIVGLSAAVKALSKTPEDSIFCILAPPQKGDSATHMHEVLLEAYCYEHDIYIVHVDDSQKLSQIMNASKIESCVLIQKQFSVSKIEKLSDDEMELVNYCELVWDVTNKPIVQLPES